MRKLYKLLAIVLASVALTSCFKDPGTDILWNGLEVEINEANLPGGVQAAFTKTSSTQEDTYEIQINLVGKPQTFPVVVNFDADATSTAIAGTHYLLPAKSVTIPAGQNVVKVPIKVLTGNLPVETNTQVTASPNIQVLLLAITSADRANPSVNYSKLRIRLRAR